MINHICEVCGKEFASISSTRRFCSQNCRMKSLRARQKAQEPKKFCAMCGKEITDKKRFKFCSDKCARKFYSPNRTENLTERQCAVCGTTFQPTVEKNIYCSKQCRKHAEYEVRRKQTAIRKAELEDTIKPKRTRTVIPKKPEDVSEQELQSIETLEQNPPSIEDIVISNHLLGSKFKPPVHRKTCEMCGKEFVTFDKRQKFCNYMCQYNSMLKDYPEKTCPYCGSKFKHRSFQDSYCSETCYNSAIDRKKHSRLYDKIDRARKLGISYGVYSTYRDILHLSDEEIAQKLGISNS